MGKIKVSFNVDSNGILEVTAEDTKSHNKSEIRITNEKGRLTQDQIDKMLEDADKFKDEDDLAVEEGVAREALKSFMNRVRVAMQEIEPGKITGKDKHKMETKLTEMDDWMIKKGERAPKQELDAKQRDFELLWSGVAHRMSNPEVDFYNLPSSELPKGEDYISNGGWFLECGEDLRNLIADVE